ncbi:hypothetical protein [Nostoc sp. NMS4]|uniref:hypothetical protein n=1 Tax=Nostoc sp. NMS4 TaxID=2815390 RepID=UPI0025ECD2B6|nr:hypothetical protein [Nostoc sp. NMS4]MBN3926433.1 hypothetical protein [Nostoc sp. NMS4]
MRLNLTNRVLVGATECNLMKAKTVLRSITTAGFVFLSIGFSLGVFQSPANAKDLCERAGICASPPERPTKSSIVKRLSGNFRGTGGQQEAIIHDLGRNRIQILVDGVVWFDSGDGEFNFSSTRGRCLTGLFSGSGRTDITCLYDYGNSNVGFVVFTSNGRGFSLNPWWTSGAGNMNPDMIGEIVAGDFARTGATGLRFSYKYPENTGYITMASNGSSFKVQKIDR